MDAPLGKLAHMAAVNSAPLDHFVYLPPDAALKAGRILVLANLGYAIGAAPALNWGTLSAVLRGLRRASPRARILITDRICPASSADALFDRIGLRESLDDEMRAVPADALLRRDYPNPLPQPLRHPLLVGPEALADFDCVVLVGVLEQRADDLRALVSCLHHLLPCDFPLEMPFTPQRYHDVFFTFGQHVDGAVLEAPLGQAQYRIFSGSDALAVEQTACASLGLPVPPYLAALRQTRQELA
jgi:hypothetical protein